MPPLFRSRSNISVISLIIWLLFAPSGLQAATDNAASQPFAVAFMDSMFPQVNKNDAKAVIKVWSETLAAEQGVKSGSVTRIIKTVPELIEEMKAGRIDAVGMTVIEYEELLNSVAIDPLFLNSIGGNFAEQFVLLVHKDSSIHQLRDLANKTLIINATPRTCIIKEWFDLQLVNADLPTSDKLTKRIINKPKPSETILPVFFRQVDACLTSKHSFDLMSELNPQVGKQLKVITLSEPLITTMLAFRKNFTSPDKEIILEILDHFETAVGGNQILLIFQSDGLENKPLSMVDSTLNLIRRFRQELSVH